MAVAARRMLAAVAWAARPRLIPITGFRSEDDHWGVCFVQESSVIAITPMNLHRLLIFLVSAAAGIAVGGCATTPTGRSQLMLFPEAEVEAMGVQAFSQIKAETPLSRDPDAIRIDLVEHQELAFGLVDQPVLVLVQMDVAQAVRFDHRQRELARLLLGLVALIDPPRPEAEAAVEECRGAGITPVMITESIRCAASVEASEVPNSCGCRSSCSKSRLGPEASPG